MTLWQYAPALLCLGIPYLAVNACLGGVANAEIPPIFSSLPPGLRHSLQNRLAWLRLCYLGAFNHRYRGVLQAAPKNWAARLGDFGKAARHLFFTITEPLHLPVYYRLLHIARQAGARIGRGDYGHRLTGPELVLGPEALDFPRQEQTPDRRYAGACVDSQRAEDTFDWSRLDNLRPVVYCTVGSHIDHWNRENRIKLVASVVQAFTGHPEWQLILQLTSKDAASLYQLPENIKTAAWFPQLQAMQRASLVICHGGFGTLREALFYGVPLIVYPLGVDQPGNAARVVYHHLGLAGDIRTVNPQEIESKVNTMLNDPSYRANAIRTGQSLQADNDCEHAVDFIETFIEPMRKNAAAI